MELSFIITGRIIMAHMDFREPNCLLPLSVAIGVYSQCPKEFASQLWTCCVAEGEAQSTTTSQPSFPNLGKI